MARNFLCQLVLALLCCTIARSTNFSFSAVVDGWHVIAVHDEVNLTWIASGVTWSSPLIGVSFQNRKSSNNNGCWDHQASPQNKKDPASIASLDHGTVLDSGAVVLQGNLTIADPLGSGKQVTTRWTMQMQPDRKGSMSFNITPWQQSVVRQSLNKIGSSRSWPEESLVGLWKADAYSYLSADVSLQWRLSKGERVVGGGEQYSNVDLSGKSLDFFAAEQGIGRGRTPITHALNTFAWPCGGDEYTTYSHVPALLSTHGYGVVLDNTQHIVADLTSSTLASVTVAFEMANGALLPQISGHIIGGADVRTLLPGLTDISGRMSPPPDWMLDGLIVGDEGGYKTVQNHLDILLKANVPVAGVWIQDWSGMVVSPNGAFVWWNWKLDEVRYPKWWFKKLAAQGIKVLTYINPFLTNIKNGLKDPEVFLEAQRLGYLVKDSTGNPILKKVAFADFKYGMVDVFNPEAHKWWVNILRCNVLMACDDGTPLVHAWMHDYGEYYPFDAASAAGAPKGIGSDLHNQYPIFSASAARAAADEFQNVTFFMRSGGLRSPGVAKMFWLGDQLPTYEACDGMQSALIGAMSGGMSGWTLNHADIGAFTVIDHFPRIPTPGFKFLRDRELNVRWMELCVFLNTAYRSHPGLLPKLASQVWDSDVLKQTKLLTNLFKDLRPYRESLFREAETSGIPPVRHGVLLHPNDPVWFNASASYDKNRHCLTGNQIGLFQFYFGDDVIVVPVMRKGAKTVHVYIPEGEWVHFWTNATIQGPTYTEWSAPLGVPPFFFRSGSSTWHAFFERLAEKYRPQAHATSVHEIVV